MSPSADRFTKYGADMSGIRMGRDLKLVSLGILVVVIWPLGYAYVNLLFIPLLLLASGMLLVHPNRVGIAVPVLLWLGSEWVVWGLSFVLLDVVFAQFSGSNVQLRADLLCLHFSGALTGLVLGTRFLSAAPRGYHSLENELTLLRRTYLLTFAVTLAYLSAFLWVGGLVARRDIGNFVSSDQGFYWLRGLEAVPYGFFFVAGRLIALEPLKTTRWIFAAAPVLIATLYLLTGGRGVALFLLLIATFSHFLVHRRFSLRTAMRLLVVGLVWTAVIVFIGAIRDSAHFENASSVPDRLWAVMEVSGGVITDLEDGLRNGLLRITEPQAQTVIEVVAGSPQQDGFEHFDRLWSLWLPAFVFNDAKKPLEDGPEVLRERFGFLDIDDFKSIPITLIADGFRRCGFIGVFMSAAFIAILLVILNTALTRQVRNPLAKDLGMILLATMALKLYPMSLLGTIGYLLYTLPRNLAINWLLLYLGKMGWRSPGMKWFSRRISRR